MKFKDVAVVLCVCERVCVLRHTINTQCSSALTHTHTRARAPTPTPTHTHAICTYTLVLEHTAAAHCCTTTGIIAVAPPRLDVPRVAPRPLLDETIGLVAPLASEPHVAEPAGVRALL
jgi:hypothetical protein